ncbi:MAG: hypothetical protein EB084_09370 [Proteobacteria bacterium]|nr:hypothetical protein [Pseudomonadota bacterium]
MPERITLPAVSVLDLDAWQHEVVRHPTQEAAEAAAEEDARMLVGSEVYVHLVDLPGGADYLFDPPVKVRVTKVAPHPTNDAELAYADAYVDFVFCDPEDAKVAPGAWTYARQHAYPRTRP